MDLGFQDGPEDHVLVAVGGDSDETGLAALFGLLQGVHNGFEEHGFPGLDVVEIDDVDIVQSRRCRLMSKFLVRSRPWSRPKSFPACRGLAGTLVEMKKESRGGL